MTEILEKAETGRAPSPSGPGRSTPSVGGMIGDLKPYPAYKDSGVSWLRQVPVHWEVTKLKTIAKRIQNGSTPPTDSPQYYSDEGLPWFGPPSLGASLTMGRPTRSVSDLAIRDGKVRPISPPALAVSVIGNVGRSALMVEPGATNQQITCFELWEQRVDARFVAYQFRLAESDLAASASSATIAILDTFQLRSTGLAIPVTKAEQAAIARFLDYADRRIRRYIGAKKKLIALLNEQKQAIIHRAVTRGLDPDVRLRPSGVDWLGDVPEPWELARLGSLLQERGEMNRDESVTFVLSLLRNRGVIPYEDKGNIGNKKPDDITRYKIVRPDDIVLNSMNVIIGSVGLSSYTGCLSPVYYVLVRRSERDDPEYLNAVFQCRSFHQSLVRIGNGILAHRMRIPMELLKCELLPHPPPEEQARIVLALRAMTRDCDDAISHAEREVDLVREYRTRLVVLPTRVVDGHAADRRLSGE